MSYPPDILSKSVAYANIKRHRVFMNSVNIYEGNYKELNKLFNQHKTLDIGLVLDSKYGRRRLSKYHANISRALHNYLASTFSLIRASSVYHKESFEPRNLLLEYRDKVEKELNTQPVKKFIEDLRSFLQHKEFPNILTTTVYEPLPNINYKTYIKFHVEDLKRFNHWSSLSLKYIKANAKSLVIPKAIDEFHVLMMGFTSWFIDQAEKSLVDDRIEVENLKDQLKIDSIKFLVKMFFTFNNLSSTVLENTFLPKFKKGEKLTIKREKDPHKRASKILTILKNYTDTIEEFDNNVIRLYD